MQSIFKLGIEWVMEPLVFRSLASGSSGNSYYIGTRYRGILIDAGIAARTIQHDLREMGLDFQNIMAVIVTHDHADHIRAVGTLGEKVHLPIYTTPQIHEGIDRNYGVREKLRTSRRYIEKNKTFDVGGIKITALSVSHDSTDCLSYVVDFLGQRFMLVTDCGTPSTELEEYMMTTNHLVIEANHDEHMLLNGPYPTYLKQRILSPLGHQSNATCGQVLQRVYNKGLRNIWLCHLSPENNTPQVAYDTVAQALLDIGVVPGEDVFLRSLDRLDPSPVYHLTDEIIKEESISNNQ